MAYELSKVPQQFMELCKRIDTSKPKEADLARFRNWLEKTPDLWRSIGDMSRHAESQLIDKYIVGPATLKESMHVGIEAVRRELEYLNAPPLEKLLIEQVALCWLRLSILELKHAKQMHTNTTIPQADFWDRTLSAAQRRFLRAIETLARVRRLLRPEAVQVNVGETVNAAQVVAKTGGDHGCP